MDTTRSAAPREKVLEGSLEERSRKAIDERELRVRLHVVDGFEIEHRRVPDDPPELGREGAPHVRCLGGVERERDGFSEAQGGRAFEQRPS